MPLTATIKPAPIACTAFGDCDVLRAQVRAEGIPNLHVRSTHWTRIRLRVKPTVGRIVVFGSALFAHHKRLHRYVRPVVRQRLDDAETRATVRAVGERIAIAPVARIEDFA
jgi:hypothetical protein